MINIHDAVYAAYSNAVTVRGNDISSLEVFDANGKLIAIDSSVVTAELATMQAAEVAAEQAQATAKASALAKLSALGLTQDEINALIG
jgi:roadblock/LC7 domain-containing protein